MKQSEILTICRPRIPRSQDRTLSPGAQPKGDFDGLEPETDPGDDLARLLLAPRKIVVVHSHALLQTKDVWEHMQHKLGPGTRAPETTGHDSIHHFAPSSKGALFSAHLRNVICLRAPPVVMIEINIDLLEQLSPITDSNTSTLADYGIQGTAKIH